MTVEGDNGLQMLQCLEGNGGCGGGVGVTVPRAAALHHAAMPLDAHCGKCVARPVTAHSVQHTNEPRQQRSNIEVKKL